MAGKFEGTYSADQVTVTVGGVIVSGFTDGDFVSAEYDDDRFKKHVGADGDVGRAKNPSRAGNITVTLSASSPANDELSALFNLESLAGVDAPIAIGVVDLSGRTVIAASKAWIKKAPKVGFGKEIGSREWVLDCADLSMFIGGNS
ncbi:MAG: phage structural protein [Burkholderiaceae bacterium]